MSLKNFLFSSKNETLIKLILLPLYFYYLVAIDSFTIFYILPVLISIFFKLEKEHFLYVFGLSYLIDPLSAISFSNEYGTTKFFAASSAEFGLAYSVASYLVAQFVFLAFCYFSYKKLFPILSRHRKKFLLFIFIFFLVLQIFTQIARSTNIGVLGLVLFGSVILISKKFWIFLLALQTYFYSTEAKSFPEFLKNMVIYSPQSRENFDSQVYLNRDIKIYFKGILLCVVFVAYFKLKLLFYLLFPGIEAPVCHTDIGSAAFLSYFSERSVYINCIISNVFISGMFEKLILGFMLPVIAGYLVGLNFHLPFGNIFKANSFAELFMKIDYYYCLVIQRFFVNETFQFGLKFRRSLPRFVFSKFVLFFSIFVGGLIFHMNRDANYAVIYGWDYFPKLLEGPVIYFMLLGLFMSFKMRLFGSNRILNVFFWLFLLVVIRSLNTFYTIDDLESRFRFLLKTFF